MQPGRGKLNSWVYKEKGAMLKQSFARLMLTEDAFASMEAECFSQMGSKRRINGKDEAKAKENDSESDESQV